MTSHPSTAQHPAHALFAGLDSVIPYPPGVMPVPEQIQGTSFFPGGTGLWHGQTAELPAFPTGGVMVLGHDFHSVQGYEWSRVNQAENLRAPTWRNLRHLLSRVPVQLEQCFFTNIYMGLREGQQDCPLSSKVRIRSNSIMAGEPSADVTSTSITS